MFEKVQNALGELSERLRSPFFYSLIISWLIYNWRVSLYILWPKTKYPGNFLESVAFFESNINNWKSFAIPILGALLYTGGQPLLRNVISAFNAWASKWGSKWVFKISGSANVSLKKYIKLRTEYEEKTRALINVLENEETLMNELNLEKAKSAETNTKLSILQEDLKDINKKYNDIHDSSLLNGYWRLEYNDKFDNRMKGGEFLYIQDNSYYVYKQPITKDILFLEALNKIEKEEIFIIQNFSIISGEHIFFTKDRISLKEGFKITHNINQIKFNHNFVKIIDANTLEGYENGTTYVKYTRII